MPREPSARWAPLVATVYVVTGLALAGCSPEGAPEAGPSPAEPSPSHEGQASEVDPGDLSGVTVQVRQGRASWAQRVVAIRVTNATEQPLTLRAATLTGPTVEGIARSDPSWSREIPVGSHRDALVQLGEPVCTEGVTTAGTTRLTLETADGRTTELAVVPTDPQGHLERIHAEDCAQRAVEAGARLRFDGTLTVTERDGVLVAAVRLLAEPVPGGPAVTFTSLDRTGLVVPVGESAWPLVGLGDPVTGPASRDLELVPSRCDPHAVAEDKRGTYFAVHATVAGTEQPVYYIGAGEALRGRLYDYIARYCAW